MCVDYKIFGFRFFFSDNIGIKIWRFEDPVLGPRKIPAINDYQTGKIRLEAGTFSINIDTNEVFLTVDGQSISVGTAFAYIVD